MPTGFEGKAALVTGGGAGIGRAPALAFAQAGSKVMIADIAEAAGQEKAGLANAAGEHAVLGLTKSAAVGYARNGIRVNAVCPGVICTAMYERAASLRALPQAMVEQLHPLGRLGEAEEAAAVVLWLCSDAASFVTGHAHTVDGGFTAV